MTKAPLRIATYNVLADAYVRPEWYMRTPADLLIAGARQNGLIKRIKALAADVVCMQEVEPALVEGLRLEFEPRGYSIEYVKKAGLKTDGCATLIHGQALNSWCVHYDDNAGEVRSGHVALVTDIEHGGRTLTVVNTHLRWNPPTRRGVDHVAYRQVEELLRHCSGGPMVVCGDLNVTASSDTVARLRRGGLTDVFLDRPMAYTCNPNGTAKRIDYLFSTPDLEGLPLPLPNIDDTTMLPSWTEPSDHVPVAADFTWAKA